MKTRTLLLLSVGTALLILLAGGVLLFQLADQDETVATNSIGDEVAVGDARVTVLGIDESADLFGVDVETGGVDDDLEGITLLTGDETLSPLTSPDAGRCTALTTATETCRLDFDVSGAQGSNRVLLVVRGDERQSWTLVA